VIFAQISTISKWIYRSRVYNYCSIGVNPVGFLPTYIACTICLEWRYGYQDCLWFAVLELNLAKQCFLVALYPSLS